MIIKFFSFNIIRGCPILTVWFEKPTTSPLSKVDNILQPTFVKGRFNVCSAEPMTTKTSWIIIFMAKYTCVLFPYNKPLLLNYVLPVTVRWWAITFMKMSVTSCIHSFIGCHGKAWNLVGLAYCQCKYPTKMKSRIGTYSRSLSSDLVNVFFNNHFINLT